MASKRWVALCAIVFFLPAGWAQGPTLEQGDAAKAMADYLANLASQAASKAAIAKSQADEAAAATNASNANAKAAFDLQQAKLNSIQSLVPDLSKYKTGTPAAPKLDGVADRIATRDAVTLAKAISDNVAVELRKLPREAAVSKTIQPCEQAHAVLVTDAPTVRGLLAANQSIQSSLDLATSELDQQTALLDGMLPPKVGQSGQHEKFVGAVIPVVLAIGQLAASVASTFKPAYGSATIETKTLFDAALGTNVQNNLSGEFVVIDPSSIVLTTSDINASTITAARNTLNRSIKAARLKVDQANARAAELAKGASREKGAAVDADTAVDKPGASLAVAAKALGDAASQAAAIETKLLTADASGLAPIDAGVRGGVIDQVIGNRCVFNLAVHGIASDVDTLAKDSTFGGLKVWLAGTSVGQWSLTSRNGVLIAGGTVLSGGKKHLQRLDLDVDDKWSGEEPKP